MLLSNIEPGRMVEFQTGAVPPIFLLLRRYLTMCSIIVKRYRYNPHFSINSAQMDLVWFVAFRSRSSLSVNDTHRIREDDKKVGALKGSPFKNMSPNSRGPRRWYKSKALHISPQGNQLLDYRMHSLESVLIQKNVLQRVASTVI